MKKKIIEFNLWVLKITLQHKKFDKLGMQIYILYIIFKGVFREKLHFSRWSFKVVLLLDLLELI